MSHIVSAFALQQLDDLEQLAKVMRRRTAPRSNPEPAPHATRRRPALARVPRWRCALAQSCRTA